MRKCNRPLNTLAPPKRMLSILANKKIYTKVDQMKEEKRNMIHKLKPLQNESIRVVEELAITQSTMKLAVQDTKKKIAIVFAQTMEEIVDKEAKIEEKVHTAKDNL
jgi:hypothetical protein